MKSSVLNTAKFLILIILNIAINLAPMFLVKYQVAMRSEVRWLAALAYGAIVVLVIVWLWKWHQKGTSADHQKQRMRWKDIGVLLLFYLVGRVVAIVGTVANQLFSGNQLSVNDQAIFGFEEGLRGSFLPFTIYFLLVVGLVAPIIEELIFRGLASQLLFNGSQKWLVGLTSSLLFAIPHSTNIIEGMMYFVLGVVFYLAYIRRGNIKDSIGLHMLNNLPAAFLLAYKIFF